MMLYPDGSGLGLPLDLITDTPFADYFIPGLFLLLINGLLQLAGALSTFKNNPFAGKAGIYLGIMLMGWIAVQVWFIGLVSFLQTFYFVLGAVEVFLGLKLSRRL